LHYFVQRTEFANVIMASGSSSEVLTNRRMAGLLGFCTIHRNRSAGCVHIYAADQSTQNNEYSYKGSIAS
jgi:hypothetical protein